ncbi:MAG: ureidoglycolate lyase [Thermaerobacter sp.]|nr:ureidoglycolate lyase [Thermaerobacter sp.]
MATSLTTVQIPVQEATAQRLQPYGVLLDGQVQRPGLSIPFYQGSVEEGDNLDFVCRGRPVIRTARISKRSPDVDWLEFHRVLTQVFIGLGGHSFVMVLGRPSPEATVPDLDQVEAFRFRPGHGVMLHQRVWHDFPMADGEPVTVFTINSEEVVAALASQALPAEMDRGDVYKVAVLSRTGKKLKVLM